MSSEPLNDSRPRWAALCRRPDAHPEVDHDSRLRCDCVCHGPDGVRWTPRMEPLFHTPRHAMLDVWSALGGDSATFEQWIDDPKRTPADAWAQLLAAIRGDTMPGDTNPPPGAILQLVWNRIVGDSLPDCRRCGHSPDVHSHDDVHDNHEATDPDCPFRCQKCDCLDYLPSGRERGIGQ